MAAWSSGRTASGRRVLVNLEQVARLEALDDARRPGGWIAYGVDGSVLGDIEALPPAAAQLVADQTGTVLCSYWPEKRGGLRVERYPVLAWAVETGGVRPIICDPDLLNGGAWCLEVKGGADGMAWVFPGWRTCDTAEEALREAAQLIKSKGEEHG